MENTSQGGNATPDGQAITNEQPTAEAQVASGGVDGANPAPSTGNPIKDAAAEARRKIKIDNEEFDEDEVIKTFKNRRSHQQAANKELQEGKKLRKQNEEFIQMLKDKGKLFDVLQKLGHNPRQLSEEYLAAQLEEEMLDPREKELRATKAQLRAYEEEKQKQKELQQKQLDDQMKRKFSEEYSTKFVEALKTEGLPPTKRMVSEMAAYIKRAADIKFEMTATEAAKLVKEDQEMHYRKLYAEADPEVLVKLLGEEGLQKIRTYDTSRLKNPAELLKTPEKQGEVRRRDKTARMSPAEWRAFNRK